MAKVLINVIIKEKELELLEAYCKLYGLQLLVIKWKSQS